MTMPKKGRREITVNNTLYHYKVRGNYDKTVSIQNTLTNICTIQTFSDKLSITPKDVKDIINETKI
jgi:hypothetical protein